ncbi:hypothetical protein MVEN_01209100 [Mycena venus]|uniref:Uncharacterized protein n=1 Tax=Mycena venus TaxID=2733690 RepID=A0A8H6Y5V5_9AGAR|nr:hypothetical protein MVEN_01209100 [Mycena venus]
MIRTTRSALRTLLILLCSVLYTVNASVLRGNTASTNAARMQAGLGPLKPKNLWSPTRPRAARDNTPSGTPPLPPQIQVRDSAGVVLGYVPNSINGFGLYGVTTGTTDRLSGVSILSKGSTAPFEIHTTNSPYPNLGFALSNGDYLSDGFFAYMVSTESMNPSSPPVNVGNTRGSNAVAQSSIWSKTSGGQLIPSWIEPNGSPVMVSLYLNTAANSLFIADARFSTGFPSVTLWLVNV